MLLDRHKIDLVCRVIKSDVFMMNSKYVFGVYHLHRGGDEERLPMSARLFRMREKLTSPFTGEFD